MDFQASYSLVDGPATKAMQVVNRQLVFVP